MQAYLWLTSLSSTAWMILQIRRESTGKVCEKFRKTVPDRVQSFLLPTRQTPASLGNSLLETQEEGSHVTTQCCYLTMLPPLFLSLSPVSA